MSTPYLYRRLSKPEQLALLTHRKSLAHPWHSPPRRLYTSPANFHITAACYEHSPTIGTTPDRLDTFTADLLQLCKQIAAHTHAWCILPNHYHLLLNISDLRSFLSSLGQFHGKTSYAWNLLDTSSGRKNFHRAVDRKIRSTGHFWATTNYIHHNPVRHGYVQRWQDWPWSSASAFLETVGHTQAVSLWNQYPIDKYGQDWDAPEF